MKNGGDTAHIPTWRLRATYLVLVAALILFLGRLYQLQVLDFNTYLVQANENRFSNVSIPAARGVIYDRNGFQLVRNIPSYNVVVTPARLPDSEAETQAIYRQLAELVDLPADKPGQLVLPDQGCVGPEYPVGIRQVVEKAASIRPYQAWPVACDIDETTARIVLQRAIDMPGVAVETIPVRDYVTGELTTAIIGYMGPIPAAEAKAYSDRGFVPNRDKVGYAGIEFEYQDILAGINGLKLVEQDVARQQLREYGEVRQPVPGNNLRLTIDTRLQAAAATALRSRMDFINRVTGERRTPLGVVIALNPQTGEILAMVSLPTYENNRLARFIPLDYYNQLVADDRGKPLINHAITSPFPPGSTFKLVTAVGSLNEGVITPGQTVDDPGLITITNQYFPNDPGKAKDFVCWKRDGHGRVNMLRAIEVSCNVYFYKVGGGFPGEVEPGLGIDRIDEYAPLLGYGSPLGVDLPGEVAGLIPTQDWKRINLGESWSTGDTYNTATGQGFVLATPLQVLNSVATLANNGRAMWPHIVQDILDGEGNVVQSFEPRQLWDMTDGSAPGGVVVQPWVIDLVQQGLHLVVQGEEGTAHQYADLETISSAGKTGTGEFCDALALQRNLCVPGNWPTHAWYAAYAPFENPEIAVVAFVYNGSEGAVTSGPVVKQILEAYFELKAIDAAQGQ